MCAEDADNLFGEMAVAEDGLPLVGPTNQTLGVRTGGRLYDILVNEDGTVEPRLDQHLASHAFAERLYGHVLELVEQGYTPSVVRDAVNELYRRARVRGQSIERDAFVEVLDELDAKYPHVAPEAGNNSTL